MFKGTINKDGRKPGTQNKVTTETKEMFSLLLSNNLDKIQTDLDSLKPKERIDVLLNIAKFVIPQMKAIEVNDITPAEGFTPLTIELKDYDNNAK
jgi:hypothetical protein